MNYKEFNQEVLYAGDKIVSVNSKDIEQLQEMAAANPRKRIRLCCHRDTGNTLHEMLIVHAKGAYVPPHKHMAKSESFHVIKGRLMVIIFKDDGHILEIVTMGEFGSNDSFFYRLSDEYYHTVIPLTEWVVFHETTNGPFIRNDMIFAPWAPDESETDKIKSYQSKLEGQATDFRKRTSLKAKETL